MKWQNKLATWIASDRSKSAEKAHHVNGPRASSVSESAKMVLAGKELDRVEKRISEIQNSYEAHHDMSEIDVGTVKELRKRQRELKDQLGFKA
jgi:hypothetical protein